MQACGKRKPRNRRRFILSYSNILEDLGYSHEQVREMLNIVTNNEDHGAFYDPDVDNTICTFPVFRTFS